MKEQKLRRLLAVVLALLLTLTMMPSVFAEGDEFKPAQNVQVTIGENVTTYVDLATAINSVAQSTGLTGPVQIKVLADHTSGGVKVVAAGPVNIEVDLDGHTVDLGNPPVGSTGYETQGLHFEKGSTVVLKNGTITSTNAGIKMLIQNYCNLTLDSVTVDFTQNGQNGQYAVSNNNGTVNITGNTSIRACENGFAFDVCDWRSAGYAGVNVTVNTTGTIDGKIEVSGNTNEAAPTLNIENGNFTAKAEIVNVLGDSSKANVAISGGTFEKQPDVALIAGDAAAVGVDGKYVIGTADEVKAAAAGATNSVEIIKAIEGLALENINPGVTVENKTETPVTVNGSALEKDGSVTIPQPVQPSEPSGPVYYPDYDEKPSQPEQPAQSAEQCYIVVCRKLNMRAGASTAAAKIGSLSRGTMIKGVVEDGWVRFTTDEGSTAYVSAVYVQSVESGSKTFTVVCRTLNVRAGAGTGYAKLGTLSRGEAVEVLDTMDGWHKIAYGDGTAWVCAKYIG